MADSTIPNLVAVTVPALTDLFGVRQSGDARDKKLTAAQLISLVTVSVPDPLLLSDGSAAAPTYSFTNSPTTGLFRPAADVLGISLAGVARFQFNGNLLRAENASGPGMINEVPSANNPTLLPAFFDEASGIGQPVNDSVSIIAATVEAVRYVEGFGTKILASYQLDATLTANAGGGQSGGLMGSSYNVFSVVATTGDSATLPSLHLKGAKIFVKNNGANAMDIFPNVGDEIDALGVNVAFSLPAGKAVLFLSSVANDTWTVMDFAVVPDPLLLGDGSAGAPSYSFTNDPDTGFFKLIDSELNVSVDGVEVATFRQSGFHVPDGTSGQAGLAFISSPSTGFHLNAGLINVALVGTTTWQFSAGSFGGTQTARPAFQDEVSSATNPNVLSNKDDQDTGLGAIQADAPVIIAGGQTALGFLELSNGVVQFPAADVAITALAGGGQGGAGALKQSYNVISVAATTGDSVTLPNSFFANSLCFIKNDGANSVDVFPAAGDDLGQGLNVAEPLAAGTGIFYIATVLNATWTPLIVAQAATFSGPSFASSNAAGPAMLNEDASGTNPTLVPDQANLGTGIGSATTDQMNFIGGGLTCMSISNVAGVRRIGFYEGAPIALQTGVAVTTAAIHAALVALRLITA